MKIKRTKQPADAGVRKYVLLIAVLGALFVFSLIYIAAGKWQDYRQSEASKYYMQGYEEGVARAVVSLFSQTENCQPTTVFVGNSTRQVIDVQCIPASR